VLAATTNNNNNSRISIPPSVVTSEAVKAMESHKVTQVQLLQTYRSSCWCQEASEWVSGQKRSTAPRGHVSALK